MFGFTKPIKAVKVLGVRTAEQTKIISTVNSSVYCCLVLYEDGTRGLLELEAKEMKKYLQYIIF